MILTTVKNYRQKKEGKIVLGAGSKKQQITESNLKRFQILGLTDTEYEINMCDILIELKRDLNI